MSILEEFAQDAGRGSVLIRGREVPARMLTGREQMLVRAAFPRPRPPLARVPGKGGLSRAPDEHDPAYLEAEQQRDFRLMAAMLAVACDLVDGFKPQWAQPIDESTTQVVHEWFRMAADKVLSTLTMHEVDEGYAGLRSLDAGLATRAYAQLIGVDPKSLPADEVEVLKIDPSKPPSETAIVMRVHARFGRDPDSDWWAGLDGAKRALLVAFEHAEGVREDVRRA